jgi:hypothetical protein
MLGLLIGIPSVMDASAEMLTIDFEQLPDGRATVQGMVVTNEYLDRYAVRFPDGVEIIACDPGLPAGVTCLAANSGTRAVQPLFENEFNRKPIDIRFDSPASSVSLYVTNDAGYDDGRQITVRMEAYDSIGRLVGRDTENFIHDQTWKRLEIGSGSASISRVIVSGGASIYSEDSNALIIDDLRFEIPEPPTPLPPDRTPPVVTFVAPLQDEAFDHHLVDLEFSAQDDRQLQQVSLGVVHLESGVEIIPFREANICGSAIYGPCQNPQSYAHEVALDPGLEGEYTASVEACDTSQLCTTEKRNFTLGGLPIDLWILGIEYNQAIQDFIFTDLTREPGSQGFISAQESDFGMPVIPGKPMAVRVYIGLRDLPNSPSIPEEGFEATGELELIIGGVPNQVLSPINHANCSEQSGMTGGQACLSNIFVHPSLGRSVQRRDPVTLITGNVDLPTLSEYDLDLIDERASLEGTLNFVIPAELLTTASASDLTLRAIVEPVGRPEAHPGDNQFALQLGQFTDPNPLDLGLVRVSTPGTAAPSFVEAQATLTEMLELMPYDSLNLERDWAYSYNMLRRTIRIQLFGLFDVAEERLTQCETLWLDLFDAFGLTNDYTLFAVSPETVNLQGCGGLGWRVPGFGGIALAENAFNVDDHNSLGTMAQEAYHAALDRRHVSNDHEEADGCFLEDGLLADVIGAIGFDTDCWKPAPYFHGSIGEYPYVSDFIYGDRGAVGMEIEPDGGSWVLTLYDPCPTGRLDRSDSLAALNWIGQRWDDFAFRADGFNISLCREHANAPHDFMSYGDNPWTSLQQYLGETLIPEELSNLTLAGHRFMASIPPVKDIVAFSAEGTDPGLQVTAVLTDSGVGFVPAFSSPPGVTPVNGDSSSPLILHVEAGDQAFEFPMAIAMTPAHSRSLLFSTASLPTGLLPDRVAIEFQGQEIAQLEASQSPPSVHVISPNGGEHWQAGESGTVIWEAFDEDGDALRVRVEYSPDAGASWLTMGIVDDASSLTVSTDDLPESLTAMVRVVATDGLRLGRDSSDATFCVRGAGGCVPLPLENRAEPRPPVIGIVLVLVVFFILGALLFMVGIWMRLRRNQG